MDRLLTVRIAAPALPGGIWQIVETEWVGNPLLKPHTLASMLLWSLIVVFVIAANASVRAEAADPDVIAAAPSIGSLVATAQRAGLRVLKGEHLVLLTDRPARAGDGVDDLPRLFDEAWATWCHHFGLDPVEHRQWRACGCLVVDRERFRAAGLLPDVASEFTNGFCHRERFWMADQSNPAYRRHLLLHEGVHAFSLTLRGLDTPPWYTEGIAEYLATHRLNDEDHFVPTPLPLRADDAEQLGRIEKLRTLRAAGTCPGLEDVFTTPAVNHRDLSAYAASWAAVAFLSQHAEHAGGFATAERGPLDAAFTERLAASPGWDAERAARNFDAFTDEIDHGYDFSRSRIDWARGQPLETRQTITVASGRGWQNSGWSLRKGERHEIDATGRCTIGVLDNTPAAPLVWLETEAEGISLRWYRGRPLGRLLVAQWVEQPDDGGRPRFVVLAEGGHDEFTAAADGVAYFKLNDPPGELADNDGHLTVEIGPLR